MLPIVTNEAVINILAAKKTLLANYKIRLWQNTLSALTINTTVADLIANEATYSGYGAITALTAPNPYLVPGGGGNLQLPTAQFQPTGTVVQNMIRGWWVELSTGEIQLAGQFDSDIAMNDVTAAIPLDIIFNQANR